MFKDQDGSRFVSDGGDHFVSAAGDESKAPGVEFIAACDCYVTELHYHRQKLVALGRCIDQQLCQKRLC